MTHHCRAPCRRDRAEYSCDWGPSEHQVRRCWARRPYLWTTRCPDPVRSSAPKVRKSASWTERSGRFEIRASGANPRPASTPGCPAHAVHLQRTQICRICKFWRKNSRNFFKKKFILRDESRRFAHDDKLENVFIRLNVGTGKSIISAFRRQDDDGSAQHGKFPVCWKEIWNLNKSNEGRFD